MHNKPSTTKTVGEDRLIKKRDKFNKKCKQKRVKIQNFEIPACRGPKHLFV